ncbi:M12 family metallo-peptidase [Dyadobacter sp. LHD-138]|uniref:M12 family metallo-peptidase n=1 Tax=Dyadobacter sp. LHD-138 TaxID=3071413 RepID=UPI0027DFE2EF|nr:M12 family metallo-peptidase [Dyadobacter sp. LHD-138]MDQ6479712.1 M12 family metallo-peptidase [Dyadobacter sp. LHD-138]
MIKADLENIFFKLENEPNGQIELAFSGQPRWTFELAENNLLSAGYFETVAGSNGVRKRSNSTVKTFDGTLQGGKGKISLTVDHGFFSAVIKDGGHTWYIEQAQYINGESDHEVLVMYDALDVIDGTPFRCGVEEDKNKAEELLQSNSGMRTSANGCKVVELAIASDASMFTKFGSTAAVFNHNIAVMNNVAVLYRHEFQDNIEFSIVTQYGSMAYSNDPLLSNTTSTDPNTVLTAFAAWGEAGNFSVTFDVGQFWTNRNFDGTTVGLAWVGSVCRNSNKYHILQDFSPDVSLLTVLTAHEIGHNFNASHDVAAGSSTIMAPTVNVTSAWSSDSQTDINSRLGTYGCLSNCNGTVTPAFIAMPSAVCVGGTVEFKDNTVNGSTRSWTFQSGSPASSTLAKPAITYSTAGAYDVNLVSGIKSLVADDYVIVNNPALNTASCSLPSGTPGNAGLKYFALNSINFSSGNAASDGSKYVDRSCTQITELKENTLYDVIASIGNYDEDVTPTIFERIKVYIDYDNDGLFNETTERVVNSNGGWAGHLTYDATSRPWLRFTTPSNVTKNKILRLRVITDTSNPSHACHNTVAGQVEDYGVVFRQTNTALPVDLISFSGKKNGSSNLLEWKTVNETKMKSYAVERSETGTGFSDIGTVLSNNTGKKQFSYQLTDDGIFNSVGGYYYKLRMEEMDGKVNFSRMIFVKNPDTQSALVLQHCQTLVGDDISYELVSDTERIVHIALFNILGNRVRAWENGFPRAVIKSRTT